MSQNDQNDRIFSIGATAKEVGVSPHVLRKWQSRFAVVDPLRGKNGRRMYSQEQVDRLRLIKNLMDSGVELKELATKPTEELDRLSQKKLEAGLIRVFGSPFIEGPKPAPPPGVEISLHYESGSWQAWQEIDAAPADLLVLEIANLDLATARSLREFGDNTSATLLVIYRYAHSSLLAMLRSANIKAHRGPVSVWLVADLMATRQSPEKRDENRLTPVAPRRYTESMVMRVSNTADVVECECPKNIANILTDLYAFENYSLECVVAQPDDREIHQYLHQVTANARSLFEAALGRLAEHEGIDLK